MKKWMIFFDIVAALLVGANSYAPQLAEAGLCQALSATLNLHSDDVRVQGRVKLGGLVSAQADVRGHFGMKGSKLMFIPSSVTVEGMGMQISTTQMANAEIYDFAEFPLGIQPDSVTMRDGLLTIHGQVSNS